MNIKTIQDKFLAGEISVEDHVKECYEKIKENDLNSFVSLNEEEALVKARELDQKIADGEDLGRLFGVSFSIKDNISTKGLRTTCASKMLEDYVPLFDASVVERIREEDGIIVGKANMDEFAMGGSGDTSFFGPTKNPLDKTLITGGSSSGSAASVKGGECIVSLGSDTGGSVRQPASYCSLYGYYPSYGTISRFGVAPMANTLDQVGVLANSVEDIGIVMEIIGGHDDKDPNSYEDNINFELEEMNLEGKKIGVFKSLKDIHVDDEIMEAYQKSLGLFEEMGAELVEVDLKMLKYVNAMYNILMNVEVSSNMSRYDGIRFGHVSDKKSEDVDEFYKNNRGEGLGREVKKRIALGYYLSSKGQEDYQRALKARKLLREEMDSVFEEIDFILSPTATVLPAKIGERTDDPLQAFDSGAFNVLTNLASLCAISLPTKENKPIGIQLMAGRRKDKDLLEAAMAYDMKRKSHDQD